VTLGRPDGPCSLCGEPVTSGHAQEELENVMADVRRGLYIPRRRETAPVEVEPEEATPTFRGFAWKWLEGMESEVIEALAYE
jgi:hypothetical protein